MPIFPAAHDDLLDVSALPPTDSTELNYRTRPLSFDQELRLTLVMLLGTVSVLLPLSCATRWLSDLWPLSEWLMTAAAALLAVWLMIRRVMGAPYLYALAASLLLAAAVLGSHVLKWTAAAPDGSCRLSLLLLWLTAALITRQVAAWILVNPTVDHETLQRWQVNLPRIVPHGLSFDCPELLTWSVSGLFIGPAWWCAAWAATSWLDAFWLWPVCLIAVLHAVWLGWHLLAGLFLPWPNAIRCWRMACQALLVFTTYDVYHTPAAGVFRFPDRWLRAPLHRWLLLVLTLCLTACCCVTACPSPAETWRQGGSFVGQLLFNLAFSALVAPALLASMLWFVGGSLLARFERELTAKDENEKSDWDNYIDRLINSEDDLESQHLLYGTTLQGDYPVLLHCDILDQHAHLIGDTGASKTSLGIAPLAAQLIARADATVVIVDLKGDRALFETCRREAARTRKLRFRWLANEVGLSTFAFNPFLQSHNEKLSTDQFVQQLLQGLSLDYGLAYGAGYFTAMNEIVLSTVLKNCQARSFRELDARLQDRSFYEAIGQKQDWQQARHLAALVSRLAGSELLNVVPGTFPDRPEVHAQQLDAKNLFEEPQVVYLSLRSSVEATNAPTIARLFLWAAFTAACRRKPGGHRVYFFLDEFQQVLSDGIKLIFEQFRDLGGTIIAAHQTAGQLRRHGTDLGETVDSCTAVKQVLRASDLMSQERLEKLAGTRREAVASWMQPYEPGVGDLLDRFTPLHAREGLVRVRDEERPRLDRRRLQQVSSGRQSSLVRFTFGSGYTQFAGATVPMISAFPVTYPEYLRRKAAGWPTAPGAFAVKTAPPPPDGLTLSGAEPAAPAAAEDPAPKPAQPGPPVPPAEPDFLQEFERRGRET